MFRTSTSGNARRNACVKHFQVISVQHGVALSLYRDTSGCDFVSHKDWLGLLHSVINWIWYMQYNSTSIFLSVQTVGLGFPHPLLEAIAFSGCKRWVRAAFGFL